MRDHISDVCRSTYLSLRRIGSIRHLLTDKAAICLVNALITSRLDFCSSTLAGFNVDKVYRLQRLQNAAARLVTKKRKHEHISPVLFDLHWLPVSYCIKFKLCVLVYCHFEETLPPYLSSVFKTYHPQRSLRSSTHKTSCNSTCQLEVCRWTFFSLRCLYWMDLPPYSHSASHLHWLNFKKT